ncbi:hypothetical protein A33Q_1489 [Indibacter alkaliphilus LW1]|uniref:Uncharacterized protein n=1 Tax=Indibacter alkaliphilus (strain CCUG 57479 / KCTC 22604 / LW1) TaxID=1189612 RepID=S2DGE4_INDAL|nr:hypothetical protein [Indibacter alkaliphilus]EOZ98127.1 hypothetical protein A33Q_1489 [Indibacter alkaliphilus LW1]
MRNFILIVSLFLLAIGLFNFFKYVSDFNELSSYGKGYLAGSLIFILIGGTLSFLIIKRKIKASQSPE